MASPSYILLTAARNEERFLEATIASVLDQTVRPAAWIIVSDGSTDRTDGIVQAFVNQHPFITLLRVEATGQRNFGSKALSINHAYERGRLTPHDYVGVLDADVTLDPGYYRWAMARMEEDRELGIVGGILFDEVDGARIRKDISTGWSVCGPIQFFRRACFEGIGGYRRMTYGGVDAVAETMARMAGWKVKTLPGSQAVHHRETGSVGQSRLQALFRLGVQNHSVGYHPLFMLARAARRLLHAPPVVGAGALLAGYTWAFFTRVPRLVDPAFVAYLRREQMQRLRSARR